MYRVCHFIGRDCVILYHAVGPSSTSSIFQRITHLQQHLHQHIHLHLHQKLHQHFHQHLSQHFNKHHSQHVRQHNHQKSHRTEQKYSFMLYHAGGRTRGSAFEPRLPFNCGRLAVHVVCWCDMSVGILWREVQVHIHKASLDGSILHGDGGGGQNMYVPVRMHRPGPLFYTFYLPSLYVLSLDFLGAINRYSLHLIKCDYIFYSLLILCF